MNSASVNLGAGGFVSYFEDGGASVALPDTTSPAQEIEEYTQGLSPGAQKVILETASKMDSERLPAFLASLQMADTEFEMDVGRYMPEGSTVDPSRARLLSYPEEAGVGPSGLTLMGLARHADTPPTTESFRGYTVDIEPNTVNAIEAVNAKPWLWAHEYRHLEETDVEPGIRSVTAHNTREISNQIQDVLSAQNPDEVRARSTELLQHLFYSTELSGGQEKRVQDLYKKLFSSNSSDEELPELVQEVLDISSLKKLADLVLDKDKVRHSPYFEQNIGYLTSEREGLQKPTMPKSYKNGGRVEEEFDERGVGTFFAEQFTPFADPPEGTRFQAGEERAIRDSGNPGSADRGTYYPEGATFFEALEQGYDYPLVEDPIDGPNRHSRPYGREDLPTPQEMADTRSHMLGSALMAADYGPKTAMTVGNLGEDIGFSDRRHRAMDKRNNAVGISIFKQAGMDATPAQLAQMVDAKIFKQLDAIIGRSADNRSFKSPEKGPDLYIPRDQYGYFVSDY